MEKSYSSETELISLPRYSPHFVVTLLTTAAIGHIPERDEQIPRLSTKFL
jgi:hypothetical protein